MSKRSRREYRANGADQHPKVPWPALVLSAIVLVGSLAASVVNAQEASRAARFEWDANRRLLYAWVSYRDVIDGKIRNKLSRGLPTTIVLTATVHGVGRSTPVATTAQSCKVTWHVWEEAFRVELDRPGDHQTRWTTTVEGVLRRCAEANRLLAADSSQLSEKTPIYLQAIVQVNPIGQEILQKIKRWVSRPSGTGTAAPGDALFGTFTGLFLQRIGSAERELRFRTLPSVPTRAPKKRPK